MSNSESGSSCFPLRRSPRLLGKSRRSLRLLGKPAVSLKQRIKSSIRKPRDDLFPDKRVYINSSGDTCSWIDRSTGCMWVAVQGMKSICVAVRQTLDMDRFPGFSESMFCRYFFLNVVSGIEDITMSTSDLRQTLDKHVTKPLGVVSVIQSTTTMAKKMASDALKFLKKRFESGLAFNHIETLQTAISALQHVCNQELKTDDIWVCVLDRESEYRLQREQLEEHLAVVNGKAFADRRNQGEFCCHDQEAFTDRRNRGAFGCHEQKTFID